MYEMVRMKSQGGFTLIEMLIVIVIVGILSTLTLVALGPVQRQGRDARRLSDVRQVQTLVELYYSKKGEYPSGSGGSGSWDDLKTALTGASLGATKIPNDPSSGRSYEYGASSDGTDYVIGVRLEVEGSGALNDDVDDATYGVDCEDPIYCLGGL